MPTPHPPLPDDQRLREHLAEAHLRGRPIGHKTALELAHWFAESVGPGFEIFLTTGAVTGRLYTELGRLYDLRTDESKQWLDNLSRFVVHQPIMANRGRQTPVEPEDRS